MNIQHTFRVDMNSLQGNEIGTLLTHAADPIGAQLRRPLIGSTVQIVDEDGNRWSASVMRMHGIWLGLRVDWSTMVPAFHLRLDV